MKRDTLFHTKVLLNIPLCEKVGWQLHTAPKSSPNHGRRSSAIPPLHSLSLVDPAEPIQRSLVLMLRSDGQERGIRLQAGLDEEERGSEGGTNDARGGTRSYVDAKHLLLGVIVEETRCMCPNRLVETQSASVQTDLVAKLSKSDSVHHSVACETYSCRQPLHQSPHAFILENDRHALKDTSVQPRCTFCGQLSLKLQSGIVSRYPSSADSTSYLVLTVSKGWVTHTAIHA